MNIIWIIRVWWIIDWYLFWCSWWRLLDKLINDTRIITKVSVGNSPYVIVYLCNLQQVSCNVVWWMLTIWYFIYRDHTTTTHWYQAGVVWLVPGLRHCGGEEENLAELLGLDIDQPDSAELHQVSSVTSTPQSRQPSPRHFVILIV